MRGHFPSLGGVIELQVFLVASGVNGACVFHFIDKNIDISEAEAALVEGVAPKLAEVLVALLLVDAVHHFGRVVRDQVYLNELDEVDAQDQHSVLDAGGLVVRGEDPIVVAGEAVPAADDDVVAAVDRILLADDDVVVLDQVVPHPLQQIGHAKHLLVDQTTYPATLRVLAHQLRMSSEVTTKTPHSSELAALVFLLQPAVAAQVPANLFIALPRLAIDVGLEGIEQISDSTTCLSKQCGIDVEASEVVLSAGSRAEGKQEKESHLANFHLEQLLARLFDFDQISNCSISPLRQGKRVEAGTTTVLGWFSIIVITYMTTWLGDKYEGEHKEGWYHGYGRLEMQNGIVYEGQFVKGQFHGEGKLIYPNGGYYKAQWVEGKMTAGEYIFNDNLSFEKEGWKHCINDDRRFYQEYLHGIKPSGATQQTREDKPHNIPTGTYDTGDGYYEPVKSIVYNYDGKIHRTPTEEQVKFILEKCRYVPKAVDIDGSKDRVIKKILEIENKK